MLAPHLLNSLDVVRQPHLNGQDMPAQESRAKGNGALYDFHIVTQMVYRSHRNEMVLDERSGKV